MQSAFGVEHGEISKAGFGSGGMVGAAKNAGRLEKLKSVASAPGGAAAAGAGAGGFVAGATAGKLSNRKKK